MARKDPQTHQSIGKYYHGQSGFKEIWLSPKKFPHDGVDYYVSGTVDGIEDGTLIELKTTWFSSKTKIQSVINRAQRQADIYSWMGGYKEAKIIIKNLSKPELDETVHYRPQTGDIEELLAAYIIKNKESIKMY